MVLYSHSFKKESYEENLVQFYGSVRLGSDEFL